MHGRVGHDQRNLVLTQQIDELVLHEARMTNLKGVPKLLPWIGRGEPRAAGDALVVLAREHGRRAAGLRQQIEERSQTVGRI